MLSTKSKGDVKPLFYRQISCYCSSEGICNPVGSGIASNTVHVCQKMGLAVTYRNDIEGMENQLF